MLRNLNCYIFILVFSLFYSGINASQINVSSSNVSWGDCLSTGACDFMFAVSNISATLPDAGVLSTETTISIKANATENNNSLTINNLNANGNNLILSNYTDNNLMINIFDGNNSSSEFTIKGKNINAIFKNSAVIKAIDSGDINDQSIRLSAPDYNTVLDLTSIGDSTSFTVYNTNWAQLEYSAQVINRLEAIQFDNTNTVELLNNNESDISLAGYNNSEVDTIVLTTNLVSDLNVTINDILSNVKLYTTKEVGVTAITNLVVKSANLELVDNFVLTGDIEIDNAIINAGALTYTDSENTIKVNNVGSFISNNAVVQFKSEDSAFQSKVASCDTRLCFSNDGSTNANATINAYKNVQFSNMSFNELGILADADIVLDGVTLNSLKVNDGKVNLDVSNSNIDNMYVNNNLTLSSSQSDTFTLTELHLNSSAALELEGITKISVEKLIINAETEIISNNNDILWSVADELQVKSNLSRSYTMNFASIASLILDSNTEFSFTGVFPGDTKIAEGARVNYYISDNSAKSSVLTPSLVMEDSSRFLIYSSSGKYDGAFNNLLPIGLYIDIKDKSVSIQDNDYLSYYFNNHDETEPFNFSYAIPISYLRIQAKSDKDSMRVLNVENTSIELKNATIDTSVSATFEVSLSSSALVLTDELKINNDNNDTNAKIRFNMNKDYSYDYGGYIDAEDLSNIIGNIIFNFNDEATYDLTASSTNAVMDVVVLDGAHINIRKNSKNVNIYSSGKDNLVYCTDGCDLNSVSTQQKLEIASNNNIIINEISNKQSAIDDDLADREYNVDIVANAYMNDFNYVLSDYNDDARGGTRDDSVDRYLEIKDAANISADTKVNLGLKNGTYWYINKDDNLENLRSVKLSLYRASNKHTAIVVDDNSDLNIKQLNIIISFAYDDNIFLDDFGSDLGKFTIIDNFNVIQNINISVDSNNDSYIINHNTNDQDKYTVNVKVKSLNEVYNIGNNLYYKKILNYLSDVSWYEDKDSELRNKVNYFILGDRSNIRKTLAQSLELVRPLSSRVIWDIDNITYTSFDNYASKEKEYNGVKVGVAGLLNSANVTNNNMNLKDIDISTNTAIAYLGYGVINKDSSSYSASISLGYTFGNANNKTWDIDQSSYQIMGSMNYSFVSPWMVKGSVYFSKNKYSASKERYLEDDDSGDDAIRIDDKLSTDIDTYLLNARFDISYSVKIYNFLILPSTNIRAGLSKMNDYVESSNIDNVMVFDVRGHNSYHTSISFGASGSFYKPWVLSGLSINPSIYADVTLYSKDNIRTSIRVHNSRLSNYLDIFDDNSHSEIYFHVGADAHIVFSDLVNINLFSDYSYSNTISSVVFGGKIGIIL